MRYWIDQVKYKMNEIKSFIKNRYKKKQGVNQAFEVLHLGLKLMITPYHYTRMHLIQDTISLTSDLQFVDR